MSIWQTRQPPEDSVQGRGTFGRGQTQKPKPGPKLSPADVKTYGDDAVRL